VLFEDSKTGQQLSPEEIIAMLLSWGKQMSTDYADVEFIRATVLTAPVYFTQQQRELLQQAATLAGLEVLAVIDDLSAGILLSKHIHN
jgi:molecular chaperone DnaK (HSP70)